jgi:general secretion pathway protein G
MKINPRRGKAAFTLIELMAVITIIVILAGLVVGGMGFVTERQAKEKAKVQIALLSKAIEEYKLDMGKYPGSANDTPAAGTISAELYDRLFFQGVEFGDDSARTDTPADPKATKIYLADLDPRSTKQGWVPLPTGFKQDSPKPPATQKILDPWGKEYYYRKGTNAVNPDFDLWTAGKDGKTKTATTASDMNNADMKDDIKNF